MHLDAFRLSLGLAAAAVLVGCSTVPTAPASAPTQTIAGFHTLTNDAPPPCPPKKVKVANFGNLNVIGPWDDRCCYDYKKLVNYGNLNVIRWPPEWWSR